MNEQYGAPLTFVDKRDFDTVGVECVHELALFALCALDTAGRLGYLIGHSIA